MNLDFRLVAQTNAMMYEERTKLWHDKHIIARNAKLGSSVIVLFQAAVISSSNLDGLDYYCS